MPAVDMNYPSLVALSGKMRETMGMTRFSQLWLAWSVATIVAISIAAAAVGSVRSEVTDAPIALGVSASPAITVATSAEFPDAPDERPILDQQPPATLVPVVDSSSEPSTTTSTTTTTRPPLTAEVLRSTSPAQPEDISKSRPQGGPTTSVSTAPAAEPSVTSTTTTTPPTATTATTAPPATVTTTTTIPAPKAYTRVIETEGGSFSIRVDGDAVVFRRAFPNNGWQFNLIDGGPEAVEVGFREIDNRSTKFTVLVTLVDGVLDISNTLST